MDTRHYGKLALLWHDYTRQVHSWRRIEKGKPFSVCICGQELRGEKFVIVTAGRKSMSDLAPRDRKCQAEIQPCSFSFFFVFYYKETTNLWAPCGLFFLSWLVENGLFVVLSKKVALLNTLAGQSFF